MANTFRSLVNLNYRRWAAGAIVSNIGTWMQRTAQDWLVLTILTPHNGTALGIVLAMQFAPQLLMLPFSGYAADHFDRRKILLLTQAVMGILALSLGVLTLAGWVTLWQVYVFAFLLGCTAAFDAPARQTFVSELVGEAELPNAVALNSTSFNAARLIGPAIAGMAIAVVGCGWVFIINGLSFAGVLLALLRLEGERLFKSARDNKSKRRMVDGFRYIAGRSDLKAMYLMMFIIGMFGMNFPVFIATAAVKIFDANAGQYGLLTSMLAIGSVTGALLSAHRARPSMGILCGSAVVFSLGFVLAALMPTFWLFGCALVVIGIAAQTLTTSIMSLVQIRVEPAIRGRVIAILFAITMGGTPLGAPIVGWVADHWGPHGALLVGAASGLVAALVIGRYMLKHSDDGVA